MPAQDAQSLLDAIHGEAGCKKLAQDFYSRVARSHELKDLFTGKSVRCATEEFSAFLIQFLDGDPDQTQYRWWLSLSESHARFQISEQHRQVWLALMGESIESVVDDVALRLALNQFFDTVSCYILGTGEAEVAHPELKDRWAAQLALDQLVEHIVNKRDLEAIAVSRRFVSRPSVFAAVLARMMEADREPLATFVLESVRAHRHLTETRYNGRPLIHLAAGYSCVPVVQELLDLGVDPNLLDTGGHSPLYRVANGRNSVRGAEIVRALIRAGANVHHQGGVSQATALHEAARHGDMLVAKALLDAGASPKARDSKHRTPLDRAVSRRRVDIVALLNAFL